MRGLLFLKINLERYCVLPYIRTMNETRKPRAYKITDKNYDAAMKRAGKNKVKLATMIEFIVASYGGGSSSIVFTSNTKSSKTK